MWIRRMIERKNKGEVSWKTYLSEDPIPAEFDEFFQRMRTAGLTLLLDEEYTVLCRYAAKGGYYGNGSAERDSETCNRCVRKDPAAADQFDQDSASKAGFGERAV